MAALVSEGFVFTATHPQHMLSSCNTLNRDVIGHPGLNQPPLIALFGALKTCKMLLYTHGLAAASAAVGFG